MIMIIIMIIAQLSVMMIIIIIMIMKYDNEVIMNLSLEAMSSLS